MPSERESKFRGYCAGLERQIGPGRDLQSSKGRAGGAGVHGGETVNTSPKRSEEHDRLDAEENLRYIESESKEFQRIASKYRWTLDEAIKQYKSLLGKLVLGMAGSDRSAR